MSLPIPPLQSSLGKAKKSGGVADVGVVGVVEVVVAVESLTDPLLLDFALG